MQLKRCPRCKKELLISEFRRDRRTPSGLRSECKLCHNKANELWRKANLVKVREYQKNWRKANPVKCNGYNQKWRKANPDKWNNWNKEYRGANKEKLNKNQRNFLNKVRHTLRWRLNNTMRSSISSELKGKKNGYHWELLAGYTLDQLKKHLEKQFHDGMSWENYGRWHIDHIIPISIFNFEKPEDIDFKRCWALSNLQPMWAKDNHTKSNKLDKFFQPSLIF